MPRASWEPVQITADMCNLIAAQSGPLDDRNHNVTLTVPKITPTGSNGQVVLKKGKITSYTAPT